MFFITFTRKLGALLRGSAGGREIFLASLLGVLLGITPGTNLTVVFLVILILILNANIAVVLLSAALGKVACFALAPITFRFGYTIIHRMALEGLFRAASDAPVLAWMDLHRYCLVGGIPVGVLVGIGSGIAMMRVITTLRRGILQAEERSPTMQKLAGNRLVKALLWLVFGKHKLSFEETLDKDASFIRKSGVILVVTVLVVAGLLELLLLDRVTRIGLERGLAVATGAEVNVAEADLSLLKGVLHIGELQVTDPDKPTHNLVQVGSAEASLDVRDLLARRFTIELLELSDLRRDTTREKPGKVFRPPAKPQDPGAEDETEDSLTKYFRNVEELKAKLEKLKRYLDKMKSEKEDAGTPSDGGDQEHEGTMPARVAGQSYLELSARGLLAKRPTWTLRTVKAGGIALHPDLPPQDFQGREISSHPTLNAKPTTLELRPSAGGDATVQVVLHFDQPEAMHDMQLNLAGLPLGDTLELSDSVPIDLQQAHAAVSANGEFSAASVDMAFAVTLSDLQAQAREGKTILGLDPATTQEAFKHLDELKLSGRLGGALGAPRVQIDREVTLASLRTALVKAGKAELAKRVNDEVGKIEAKATGALKEALGDEVPLPAGGLKKLGGLIPGLGKGKDGEDSKTGKQEEKDPKESKKGLGGLLKKAF